MVQLRLLLLLLLSFAVISAQKCEIELEEVLFRPKACGIEYFKQISCKLNNLIIYNPDKDDLSMAELCFKFSRENGVSLISWIPGESTSAFVIIRLLPP
jgi:hypothetical protein